MKHTIWLSLHKQHNETDQLLTFIYVNSQNIANYVRFLELRPWSYHWVNQELSCLHLDNDEVPVSGLQVNEDGPICVPGVKQKVASWMQPGMRQGTPLMLAHLELNDDDICYECVQK